MDLPTARGKTQRVFNQVFENPLNEADIRKHHHRRLWHVNGNPDIEDVSARLRRYLHRVEPRKRIVCSQQYGNNRQPVVASAVGIQVDVRALTWR